jgi:hypothetical protein
MIAAYHPRGDTMYGPHQEIMVTLRAPRCTVMFYGRMARRGVVWEHRGNCRKQASANDRVCLIDAYDSNGEEPEQCLRRWLPKGQ